MSRKRSWAACALIVALALTFAACDEGGIGMGVPVDGARWGSGTPGPDIFVVGGPVYP
jgi:predicted small secreted protein